MPKVYEYATYVANKESNKKVGAPYFDIATSVIFEWEEMGVKFDNEKEHIEYIRSKRCGNSDMLNAINAFIRNYKNWNKNHSRKEIKT